MRSPTFTAILDVNIETIWNVSSRTKSLAGTLIWDE